MVDYREILRLDNLGYTKKDIASSVHSSRNTVSEVLTLAGNLHVCWPLDDDVTNQSLENLFYPGRNKDNEERLMPDYPKIHRELAKKGVTLTLLWTEYCLEASAAGKKPYMRHSSMITIVSGLVLPKQQCVSSINPVTK
ncbi:MAG: hypothetical protein V8S08_09300 [Lachnoclostridium sp.]